MKSENKATTLHILNLGLKKSLEWVLQHLQKMKDARGYDSSSLEEVQNHVKITLSDIEGRSNEGRKSRMTRTGDQETTIKRIQEL